MFLEYTVYESVPGRILRGIGRRPYGRALRVSHRFVSVKFYFFSFLHINISRDSICYKGFLRRTVTLAAPNHTSRTISHQPVTPAAPEPCRPGLTARIPQLSKIQPLILAIGHGLDQKAVLRPLTAGQKEPVPLIIGQLRRLMMQQKKRRRHAAVDLQPHSLRGRPLSAESREIPQR